MAIDMSIGKIGAVPIARNARCTGDAQFTFRVTTAGHAICGGGEGTSTSVMNIRFGTRPQGI